MNTVNIYNRAIGFAAVMALVCGLAAGEGMDSEAPFFLNVQIENDLFGLDGDRFYTNGTEITCLIPDSVPEFLEQLAETFPLFESSDSRALKLTIGQTMFTPENTENPELQRDDRPYAGYLYAGLGIASRVNVTDTVAWGNMLELTLGVVGPSSGAASAQTWVHEKLGSPSSQGWDNQLHNEPCIGLSYTRMWGFMQPVTEKTQAIVSTHLTGTIGNVYTFCGGGAMLRWGINAYNAISPPSIAPAFPGLPSFGDGCTSSWYLFIGFESRFMFRNIFLDGNTFQESHSVSKEFVVGDQMYGFAVHHGKFRAALTILQRTKEFAGQPDSTRYGAVTLTWRV